MKSITLILAFFTISLCTAQNRYSNGSTSTYSSSSSSSSESEYEYYKMLAEKRTDQIHASKQRLYALIDKSLESEVDNEFIQDMEKVRGYLLVIERGISLDQADNYLRKAGRLYNKAVKKYNKRLRKSQQ